MTSTKEYVACADGWLAGERRAKGETVKLTDAQARYENVLLKSDWDKQQSARVELTGSLDDPLVKSTGLAAKAGEETAKRGRTRK